MTDILAPIILTILLVAAVLVLIEIKNLYLDPPWHTAVAAILGAFVLFAAVTLTPYFTQTLWAQFNATPEATEGDHPVITLTVDGEQIGTVKPGTFEYRWDPESVITVETNEQVYGCRQAIIFRDRFADTMDL